MSEDRLRLAHSLAHDEPDESLRICNDILDEHFEDEIAQKALFMVGYLMMQAERFGLAYNIYKRCAHLNPSISSIYSNMGMCAEEYSPELAKSCFAEAIKRDEGNAQAYANKALIHLQTGEPQKCVELCERALERDPELRAAQHNRGLARLMLRDWGGWQDYHDTLGVKHRERRDYGVPDWAGEPGKVVVYGEQGVGDEIMFASCLEDLAKTNEVVLDCDQRLEKLFSRSFDFPVYGTRFSAETPLLDDHKPDFQCAIGQLPYFYRKEGHYPGKPYLNPDPERVIQWRALFDTFPGKKIGIAWTGGLPNTGQKRRSMELSDLAPILETDNTFISLEYKPREGLERYGVKSYPETLKGRDIDELAALVSQLDVVVTACTTVVYVAGALGVECHVLVPRCPSYRYHLTGGFPWYDSVHLHRQTGSWKGLAEQVRGEIC